MINENYFSSSGIVVLYDTNLHQKFQFFEIGNVEKTHFLTKKKNGKAAPKRVESMVSNLILPFTRKIIIFQIKVNLNI